MRKVKIIKKVDGKTVKQKYVNPLEALSIINSYNRVLGINSLEGSWHTTNEYKEMPRGETRTEVITDE